MRTKKKRKKQKRKLKIGNINYFLLILKPAPIIRRTITQRTNDFHQVSKPTPAKSCGISQFQLIITKYGPKRNQKIIKTIRKISQPMPSLL